MLDMPTKKQSPTAQVILDDQTIAYLEFIAETKHDRKLSNWLRVLLKPLIEPEIAKLTTSEKAEAIKKHQTKKNGKVKSPKKPQVEH